jgi:hypothetical protein
MPSSFKAASSAIELRSFLDRELPDWLAQLDPVIAPAVRNAESLSAESTSRVLRSFAHWRGALRLVSTPSILLPRRRCA